MNLSQNNEVLPFIGVGFLIVLVLFLVFREIVCWYFKLNAILVELRFARGENLELVKRLDQSNASLSEAVDTLRTIALQTQRLPPPVI